LPVLKVLADDPNAKVRVFAVRYLTTIGRKFPETRDVVVPVLRRAIDDDGVLDAREPKMTVGMIAAQEFSFSASKSHEQTGPFGLVQDGNPRLEAVRTCRNDAGGCSPSWRHLSRLAYFYIL